MTEMQGRASREAVDAVIVPMQGDGAPRSRGKATGPERWS